MVTNTENIKQSFRKASLFLSDDIFGSVCSKGNCDEGDKNSFGRFWNFADKPLPL